MRTSSLGILLGIALLSSSLSSSGCAPYHPAERMFTPLPVLAQVPVPTAFPLNTQPKMQAVHHWEVLAEDVAHQIHDVLERRVLERQFPVHVAPSGTTPFAKSFHALLITKLVDRNIAVTRSISDVLVLSFDIEMVRHGQRFLRTGKGVYKALTPDVFVHRASLITPSGGGALINQAMLEAAEVNVESGIYTHALPRMEVLITTSLAFEERFLMRDSSIYYINDTEWWHYKQHTLPSQPGTVTIRLVDR
ncbi:hypothetical protein [Desulfonatronum thioautotrophicum]|uniref:hypothetical protein n=1 Tax=Desulfonatronum thioautotrophicum TaxID=617001 RepID=UPI0005EB4AB7|nr:hypothetical protein [Desulfonatronum thioautotrophicum]